MANEITEIKQDDARVIAQTTISVSTMEMAEQIIVDSNEAYEMADALLSDVHGKIKALDVVADGIISPLNKALKNARALFKGPSEKLEIAKSTLKRKMGNWTVLVAKKKRDDDARIEREAEQARVDAAAALTAAEDKFAEGTASVTDLEDAHHQVDIATFVQPSASRVEAPTGNAGQGTEWKVTPLGDNKSLADLLEFIAADLRKGAPRFDNTIDIKISQLKAYAKSTNGKPIPGCSVEEVAKIIAR